MIAGLIRWSGRNLFLVGLAAILVTLAMAAPLGKKDVGST